MKTFIPGLAALVIASLGAGISDADIIDFETGFQRLDPVTSVTTASNTMNLATTAGTDLFVANVDIPKDAFEVVTPDGLIYDIPTGGMPGEFFATYGPPNPADILFDFLSPVTNFSIDIYDFRGDGGARPTDFVTLAAFSDVGRTNLVDSDRFVVPNPRPVDGNVVRLSVSAPSIAALSILSSTADRGAGIDNIEFVTVPEASTSVLLCLGMLGMLSSFRARLIRRR